MKTLFTVTGPPDAEGDRKGYVLDISLEEGHKLLLFAQQFLKQNDIVCDVIPIELDSYWMRKG